jgi:hypothetical protein
VSGRPIGRRARVVGKQQCNVGSASERRDAPDEGFCNLLDRLTLRTHAEPCEVAKHLTQVDRGHSVHCHAPCRQVKKSTPTGVITYGVT